MASANSGNSFNPATATVTTYKWRDLNNNLLYMGAADVAIDMKAATRCCRV